MQIRDELVGRTYVPLPARRQEIPKDGGKVRVLSIPAIRDRVVQGALKLILEPIFEAVIEGEKAVARLLRRAPDGVRTRASRDTLVETIPHWLYAGDTALHLAAAGLWTGVVDLLLESGADPNAENRRGARPLHYACDPRPKMGLSLIHI